jgi:predicted LPLAT superfamily acyltransferase
MSNPWQNSKERSTPFTLLTIRWIALHLGRPIARLLLYPITLYFLLFANSQRKAFLSARDSCLQHNYEGPQNYQYDCRVEDSPRHFDYSLRGRQAL